MKSLKQITENLVKLRKYLDDLYEERYSVCNRQRYNALCELIPFAEKDYETVRKEFQDKITEECGIPASSLRGYNVKDFL